MIWDGKAKRVSDLPEAFIILNLDKTKIMLVGTHQTLTEAENIVIYINNTHLKMVNNSNILGSSWKDHVECIGNKI